MLGCSLLIPAVLIWGIYCSVCVFSQGLQESVEGWEEEGNLVSDAHHLLCLFISPLSSWKTHSFFMSLLSHSLAPTFPLFSWMTGEVRGLVKAVTRESGQRMMGCSWPFSLSLAICADTVLTLAMWLH